jgi:hypothetical protein
VSIKRFSNATFRFFRYDGVDLVAETDASNMILRRYVHGPAVDDSIVWYEGTGAVPVRHGWPK